MKPMFTSVKFMFAPLAIGTAVFLLSGCGKSSSSASSAIDTTETPLAVEQGPGRDDNRQFQKKVDFGGHAYEMELLCHPDETLPQVKDRFGDPYLDNRVELTVLRDGESWYSRAFTKADFSKFLETKDAKNFILGGIAYGGINSSGLIFGAQLNNPGDEEGGWAFKVTIPLSGQGAPQIVRDANQDTSSNAAMD